MKTVGEVLNLSIKYLQDRNVMRPRRQAEELLSSLLKMQRIDLYMQFDRPLEENELSIFREWVGRRGKGEPLDYILKVRHFFNCALEVCPSVLIPRQETEILLDKVCERLQHLDLTGKVAWDLCTGSGCIGIGLKKKLPQLEVTVSDISPEALEIAKKNIESNNVDVAIVKGNLLDPFKDRKADIIICNPPYVSEEEYAALDHEVRDFEPKIALVGGPTGAECYARLAEELPRYLNPKGRAFFEIGASQGQKVFSLFNATCWKRKIIEKDWSGQDRFFFVEIE
ncbi:MAG TPA: peptide chain release factor N(5)-glutamine methyltransferase [Rhabdochlamydiaceae bacterium]|nr:peptide chain release factor N(5)-glutamine methyltransferase [Rhabdochlamydiaceae bacterium]